MNVFQFAPIIFLLLCHTAAQGNEHRTVSSAQELIDLFAASPQTVLRADITLTQDLDFAGHDIYPLGVHDKTCYPYSGVFDGAGHAVRNLCMDHFGGAQYEGAGLFCSLENATVRNLVIAASCRLRARFVGPVSVSAAGAVAVENVLNRASTDGYMRTGGILGSVLRTAGLALRLANCTNEGAIVSTGTNSGQTGGLVGQIMRVAGATVTLQNCTNRGRVEASVQAGGLAGYIGLLTDAVVRIEGCANEGAVAGSYNQIGGLVGVLEQNTDTAVTIIDSVNSGAVTGNENVGGLIGSEYDGTRVNISVLDSANTGAVSGMRVLGGVLGGTRGATDMVITLAGATNAGAVTGRYNANAAGFVGSLRLDDGSTVAVDIVDSTNAGEVRVLSGSACGFFCTDVVRDDVALRVRNSVNRGAINGSTAYGIAPYTREASCVVGLGALAGTEGAHAFWEPNPRADTLLGLHETCANCTEVVLFEKGLHGLYETLGGGARPDVLLNDAVKEHGFGRSWTSALELTPVRLDVAVGDPVAATIFVAPLTPLGALEPLQPYLLPFYALVDADDQTTIYDNRTRVTEDMRVAIVARTHVIVRVPPQTQAADVDLAAVVRALDVLVPGSARLTVPRLVALAGGEVVQIDLFVLGEDVANAIVDALRGLDRGKRCSAGILCKHTKAFIEGNEPSYARRLAPTALLFALLSFSTALR